jgi:hypothetical protein
MNILKRSHFFPLCTLLSGLPLLLLAPAQLSAQSRPPPPASVAPPPPPPKPPFHVRSYDGKQKCLDYGTPPPPPSSTMFSRGILRFQELISWAGISTGARESSPSVFLNDCTQAHSIVVEELQNGKHEVILHAGNRVIGIRRLPVNTVGAEPQSVTSPTSIAATPELPLELLNQTVAARRIDDVFALDGDSIILESSRPCVSTDATLCAPPPAQLVVQVQNARGANGSPLVVGPRNLADSEFWDFVATDIQARTQRVGLCGSRRTTIFGMQFVRHLLLKGSLAYL